MTLEERSLPPRVRGSVRGHVCLRLQTLRWLAPHAYGPCRLRFLWWGEEGAPHELVEGALLRFPVRCSPANLRAYLTDSGTLVFDVVECATARSVAETVLDLASLCATGRDAVVPLISKDGAVLGQCCLSLELPTAAGADAVADDANKTTGARKSGALVTTTAPPSKPSKPTTTRASFQQQRRHDPRKHREKNLKQTEKIAPGTTAATATGGDGTSSLAALIARGKLLREKVGRAATAVAVTPGSSGLSTTRPLPKDVLHRFKASGSQHSTDAELEALYELPPLEDDAATVADAAVDTELEVEKLFAELFFDPDGYRAVEARHNDKKKASAACTYTTVPTPSRGGVAHERRSVGVELLIDCVYIRRDVCCHLADDSVVQLSYSSSFCSGSTLSTALQLDDTDSVRFSFTHRLAALLPSGRDCASLDIHLSGSALSQPLVAQLDMEEAIASASLSDSSGRLELPLLCEGERVGIVSVCISVSFPGDNLLAADAPCRSPSPARVSISPSLSCSHSPSVSVSRASSPAVETASALSVQNGDLVVLQVAIHKVELLTAPSTRLRYAFVSYQAFADVPRVRTRAFAARHCASLEHRERIPRLFSTQLLGFLANAPLVFELWTSTSASSSTSSVGTKTMLGIAKLPLRCLIDGLSEGRYDKSFLSGSLVSLMSQIGHNAPIEVREPCTNTLVARLHLAVAIGSSSQMSTLGDALHAAALLQPVIRGMLVRRHLTNVNANADKVDVDVIDRADKAEPETVEALDPRASSSTPTSHMFVVHVNCISGLRLAPSWLLAQLEASVFVRYRFPGEVQTTSSTPVRLDTSAPSVGAIELHCVHEHYVLVAPEETLHQKLLERRADIVFEVLVTSGASEHLVGRTLLPLQMLLATVQQQRHAPSLHLFVRPSPPLLPPLPGSTACELDVALDHRVALALPTSPPQAAAALVVLVDSVSGLQKAIESDLNPSVDIALLLPGHEPQIRSTKVLPHTLEPRFRHSERFLLSPSVATLVGACVEFRIKHNVLAPSSSTNTAVTMTSILLGVATVALDAIADSPDTLIKWLPLFKSSEQRESPVGVLQVSLQLQLPDALKRKLTPTQSLIPATVDANEGGETLSNIDSSPSTPVDCRVTVELDEVLPPAWLSPESQLFVVYRFFSETSMTRSRSFTNPALSERSWVSLQHSASFVATADAEFSLYLQAEKLEVQLWRKLHETEEVLVGSAFLSLRKLWSGRHAFEGEFELVPPMGAPAGEAAGKLRASLSLALLSPPVPDSATTSPYHHATAKKFFESSHLIESHFLERSPPPPPSTSSLLLSPRPRHRPHPSTTPELPELADPTGSLTVSCVRAANLNLRLSPLNSTAGSVYVSFALHPAPAEPWKAAEGGTEAVAASSHPCWQHSCVLDVDVLPESSELLQRSFLFEVWHRPPESVRGHDVLLGRAEVPLQPLTHGSPLCAWFDIKRDLPDASVRIGHLKVSLHPDSSLVAVLRECRVDSSTQQRSPLHIVSSQNASGSLVNNQSSSSQNEPVEEGMQMSLPTSLEDDDHDGFASESSPDAEQADRQESRAGHELFESIDRQAFEEFCESPISLSELRMKMSELDDMQRRLFLLGSVDDAESVCDVSEPPASEGADEGMCDVSEPPASEGADESLCDVSELPASEGADESVCDASEPPASEGADGSLCGVSVLPASGADESLCDVSEPPASEGADESVMRMPALPVFTPAPLTSPRLSIEEQMASDLSWLSSEEIKQVFADQSIECHLADEEVPHTAVSMDDTFVQTNDAEEPELEPHEPVAGFEDDFQLAVDETPLSPRASSPSPRLSIEEEVVSDQSWHSSDEMKQAFADQSVQCHLADAEVPPTTVSMEDTFVQTNDAKEPELDEDESKLFLDENSLSPRASSPVRTPVAASTPSTSTSPPTPRASTSPPQPINRAEEQRPIGLPPLPPKPRFLFASGSTLDESERRKVERIARIQRGLT